MADLVCVTWKETNTEEIITIQEAEEAKEAGLLVIPEDDGEAMTRESVYGV